MPGSRCAQCGREEFLPFRCRLCGQPHCLEHRLPENHRCGALGDLRSRARAPGGLGPLPPERRGVPVQVRGASPLAGAASTVMGFFTRSMTHRILGVILGVFAVQWIGGLAVGAALLGSPLGGVAYVTCQLALGDCGGAALSAQGLAAKPWAVVTSVFAHDPVNPFHLFFNAIILYFFGVALEARIGPRKLLQLFLATGILAGVVQAAIFPGAVLGASGGLMGVLGVLTVLAPTLQVLFWFVPLPLWVMTGFYVLLDVMGVFSPGRGVANLAHLVGLAAGLAYGWHLRRRGVLPRITSTWAFTRRM